MIVPAAGSNIDESIIRNQRNMRIVCTIDNYQKDFILQDLLNLDRPYKQSNTN